MQTRSRRASSRRRRHRVTNKKSKQRNYRASFFQRGRNEKNVQMRVVEPVGPLHPMFNLSGKRPVAKHEYYIRVFDVQKPLTHPAGIQQLSQFNCIHRNLTPFDVKPNKIEFDYENTHVFVLHHTADDRPVAVAGLHISSPAVVLNTLCVQFEGLGLGHLFMANLFRFVMDIRGVSEMRIHGVTEAGLALYKSLGFYTFEMDGEMMYVINVAQMQIIVGQNVKFDFFPDTTNHTTQ